jgi:hypothetical protein
VREFQNKPRTISTAPPRSQAMTWLLTLLLIGLGVIGWLAWQRLPDVAFLLSDYEALTGWPALLAGWPVWALAGAVTATFSALLGVWARENAQTHDGKVALARAEQQVETYRERADNAQQEAEATLAEQVRRATITEQQAREQIAAAKAARTAANDEATRAVEQVGELEYRLAQVTLQRDNAISATHRRKERIAKLKAELTAVSHAAPQALVEENARLKAELLDSRQRLHRQEQQIAQLKRQHG